MSKQFQYAFKFQYRETESTELKTERFFISSSDPDIENACTVAMLQFLKKHNYYSGKLVEYNKL